MFFLISLHMSVCAPIEIVLLLFALGRKKKNQPPYVCGQIQVTKLSMYHHDSPIEHRAMLVGSVAYGHEQIL